LTPSNRPFSQLTEKVFGTANRLSIKLLKEDAVERPDQVVMSDPQMVAAPPGPPAAVAPKISSMKVYAAALGALVDLQKMDPELTVAAALTMARDYKDMLLPMIEEKLPDLMEDV